MRYHWGLGVGHIHAHQSTLSASRSPDKSKDSQDDRSTDFEPDEPPGENANAADTAHDGETDAPCESDNGELCLDDHDVGGWDDVETDSADGSADDSDGERDSDYDSIEDFGWM
jgi:hypothetical protein